MRRTLRYFIWRFRLVRYEDKPEYKLLMAYFFTVFVVAMLGVSIGNWIDSPQLVKGCEWAVLLLPLYGLRVAITLDSYLFLLHVEGVIKSLFCLSILIILRRYLLSFFGQLNAFEILSAILISVFARESISNWLKGLGHFFEFFREPKISTKILHEAASLGETERRRSNN